MLAFVETPEVDIARTVNAPEYTGSPFVPRCALVRARGGVHATWVDCGVFVVTAFIPSLLRRSVSNSGEVNSAYPGTAPLYRVAGFLPVA